MTDYDGKAIIRRNIKVLMILRKETFTDVALRVGATKTQISRRFKAANDVLWWADVFDVKPEVIVSGSDWVQNGGRQ